ncbi:PREDICTED: sialic acid-binding Ig-like lectin 8-like [Chrysochloris asiatica]|uniref:Sialic acid-binding Ig-like lectin 8-like n=1 Tax=Chrysochloris asiatica TaxID=185453 RepID=A0A9B0WV65_CHRAS|nr:PREDICTED: sialic acid-binding Ig-like lectin 8-like [Chrysochloris asiatica]
MLLLLLMLLQWAGFQAQNHIYWLDIQKSVTVQEGLCVYVPCSVSYPQEKWSTSTPAYGYWNRETDQPTKYLVVATNTNRKVQEETKGRFYLVGDPKKYNCSLLITDAKKTDMGSYFFRVERGQKVKYSYVSYKLSVHVAALTQAPDIHIQGTLESGHPNNVTCKMPLACKINSSLTFSWIGVAFNSQDHKTTYSSVFTLTPEPHHHGTHLTCQVAFPRADVTTKRTIQLNVSSWKLSSNGSSLPILEGESLYLVCVASSNPPAKLSWTRGNLDFQPSQPLNPGVLELPRVALGDHGQYICQAQNSLGFQKGTLILSVTSKSRIWSTVAWGAGIMVLLALCLGLIFFIVKRYKKKSSETAASMDDIHPVLNTSSQAIYVNSYPLCHSTLGHLSESSSGSPSNYSSSPTAFPISREEPELHYTSISFQRMRSWDAPEQEDADTTEYSEIKIQK